MSQAAWAGRRIHLVGIGGAGMSGYARMCAQLGASVSGSDRDASPALEHLRALGVAVTVGHARENIPDGADVFFSTAIPPDNPERVPGARPRAELLRELSAGRFTVAIGGAHGKTTTTSMTAHVLLDCGLRPGYLIGGALRTTGEHADLGGGEILVVEADESDRSFLAIDADVAVVLNVELDHHATYGSLAALQEAFAAFAAGAATSLEAPFPADDVVVEPGGSRFGWRGHEVRLQVPGAHNASNAAAALEAARLAVAAVGGHADDARLAAALASFTGAGRRFERLGATASGAELVSDYAHHPTEVAATIAAARSLAPRRLVAVFQPHLFSRTLELWERFGAALAQADLAVVLGIYPARERQEDFPGVTGMLIAGAVAHAGTPVLWVVDLSEARRVLPDRLRSGDLVLVMGAGDVDGLARALVSPSGR